METNDSIKKVILKYKKLLPTKIIKRELEVYKTKLDKANVIVGPRRAGKTYLLYDILKELKGKVPIFINFEDNLLGELSNDDLNKIPNVSKELFGEELSLGKDIVFFFDEIQAVDGWERFIVSLLNEHYEVYITGSNSKLLSKEIATTLRGKSLPYLLLPFSFNEFLQSKDITLKKNWEHSDKRFEIKRLFHRFLRYGGFPELILTKPLVLKNKLINNYFDSVLYKDLVERIGIKNTRLVEITIKYLLNLYGNLFSIVAFENYLKSSKMPYSLQDLYFILRSLQDVFMFNYVKQYSKSFKKSEFSKSKVYLFDTAYITFLSYEADDYGRILENIVFIELFRREGNIENTNIFYYKSKTDKECDFVVIHKDKVDSVIQVTWNLNYENKEREINGLVDAMKFFNLKEGLLITRDDEDKLKIDGKTIIIKPIWKWLLKK